MTGNALTSVAKMPETLIAKRIGWRRRPETASGRSGSTDRSPDRRIRPRGLAISRAN